MKKKQEKERMIAIERYLKKEEPGTIAKSMGHSRQWVYKWIRRYEGRDDEQDWCVDRSSSPQSRPGETTGDIVEAVKLVRLSLYNKGVFCGAQAIAWELEELGVRPLPSIRTINRILSREELTHRRTGRYQPKGKIYPKLVGERVNEVHQMDYVGPCYLKGPTRFYSLNCVDLATGRCAVHPVLNKAGQSTVDAIWSIWLRLGIPENQQVDNEAVFYGSRRYPRGMGTVIRLCLLSGVEPWFIPMAEPWRNGVVEKFNDHFRSRFLDRIPMNAEEDLLRESLTFEQKHNSRYRYTKLQGRTPQSALEQSRCKIRFPESPNAPAYPLPKPRSGRYHLVRFIRSDCLLDIFGERFLLPPETAYEYVVSTVHVERQKLTVGINGVTVDEFDYQMG
jgi:transposase InsO family protein